MPEVSIEWDEWGVPSISGASDVDVCHGIGQAQAVAHATEILQLYGVARGNAASMWGAEFAGQDSTYARLGLAGVIDEHMAAQDGDSMARLQAFCDGFNAACEEQPERGTNRRSVLPVTPRDVIAHVVRVFVNFATMKDISGVAFPQGGAAMAGSSAWAVSAERSTTGGSMLVINPHLLWSGFHRFFECHTVSPGREFHGIQLVGVPWQTMGFNPSLGWAHTVAPAHLMSVYALDIVDGTYLFDGRRLELETITHTISVAGEDDREVVERRSVHGPVVTAPDGAEVAVRIAGVLTLPATTALEAWWQLSLATSVDQVTEILEQYALPTFNTIAADADGRIAAVFGARPPRRSHGDHDDWEGRLPGDDPAWLWEECLEGRDLPAVVDPACGWVQNCNESPWWYCEPHLDPASFPAAIAPPLTVFPDDRSAVSRSFFRARERVSPDDLLSLKFSDRVVLADAILDEMLAAAEQEADLAEAVAVLRAWDRHARHDSRGYVLFELAMMANVTGLANSRPMLHPGEPAGALPTLADTAAAVAGLRTAVMLLGGLGLALDASLGETAEMREGETSVPADGGSSLCGVLKTVGYLPGPEKWPAIFGDTWVALVQFNKGEPPTAHGVLTYGNTTEPSAPPFKPQVELFANNELRPLTQAPTEEATTA